MKYSKTDAPLSTRIAQFAKRGTIESNLKLLGIAGLGLFITLVASLYFVQRGLVGAQERLTELTLPVQHALSRFDAALGAAFRRQAQLSASEHARELEPVRERKAIEADLRDAERGLREGMAIADGELEASARAALGDLQKQLDAFLASDTELLASVERRLASKAAFESQLGGVDSELRALIEAAQSIAGVLRLDYIVTLRRIAEAMDKSGKPPPGLVRQVTVGGTRASLDEMAELVDGVLTLGWLAGKIALAPTGDALNAVMANEIAQNRTLVGRLLESLRARLEKGGESKRLAALATRFDALFPRVGDEAREDALVHLRRSVLEETARARDIRARAEARAQALSGLIERLRGDASALARRTTNEASRAALIARVVSTLVSLLGICLCAFAALRIRASVTKLQERNEELARLKQDLEHVNKNLEGMVAERTEALHHREQALQRVLDSMSDGMISIGLDGKLLPERSKSVVRWFGEPAADATAWEYLFAEDPQGAAQFRMGFEQLVEDILPFELCIDQMLNRIVHAGHTYDLDFQPAREGERTIGMVIAVRDVTAQIEARRAEQLAREEQRIIAHLLRDKRGFGQMVRECESLVTQVIASDDLVTRRRALHTLKGNCAIFGFITVAELAHELENRLDSDETLTEADADGLARRWQESMARTEEFVHHAHDIYEIGESDLQLVLGALRQRIDYKEIVHLVESWRLEPAVAPLKRLATQAKRLAADLGKELEVQVADNGVRLPPERFQPLFAAAVHAIRNALDHGIEPPDQRVADGKPRAGTLMLSVTGAPPNAVVFELADDGAGVDFEAVAKKARLRGLPASTQEDLIEALFSDGFSTRAKVSKTSGRGVGMSALRAACEALSGSIALESTPGRGTTVRCTLPLIEATQPKPSAPLVPSGPTRRMSLHSRSIAPPGH
ncbi:MAG: ATP-binding protein [Polyangiales bacterium]